METPPEAEIEQSRTSPEIAREDQGPKRIEERLKWMSRMLERPLVGAGVAGGLVAAAAGAWGLTEAALGVAVGLIAYRTLRRRRQRAVTALTPREAAPA